MCEFEVSPAIPIPSAPRFFRSSIARTWVAHDAAAEGRGVAKDEEAEAHFLAATAWMGKIEQEAIGPLNLYNIPDTVSVPLKNDLAVKVPRYENGFLYPPEGPGFGVELNEAAVKKLATPGKSPVTIGK